MAGTITKEEALSLWDKASIYAYDSSIETDWMINPPEEVREPEEILTELIDNGCAIFTD